MFRKEIGIDLGTVNVLVHVRGKGIVLQEPSIVAISTNDNKIVAVGSEAYGMLGRTPDTIEVARPMRDGVIADYMVTHAMLRYYIEKVCGRFRFLKPKVMISVPVGVTSVESRAVHDAALEAGGKETHLIPEPLAAEITEKLSIPTIGIGAGRYCDGQIIVLHDILGLYPGFQATFVKKYANIGEDIQKAVANYAQEVREKKYPDEEHTKTE